MTRRTRTLLFRWSIVAIIIASCVWSIVSIAGGTVPTSDAGLPWPLQDVRLPFHVMRWADVPLAVPLVAAIFYLGEAGCRWEASIGKSKGSGTLPLIGCLSALWLGLFSYSNAEYQLQAISAGCVLFAGAGLLHAAFCRKVEKGLIFLSMMLIVSIFVLGFAAGPFHALLWGLLEACSAAVGLGVGRLLRKSHIPLRAIGRWLTAEGITDDLSVTGVVTATLARTPAVDPLAEFDRLRGQMTELQSRLETLRADPDTAKYLALRAERPAA